MIAVSPPAAAAPAPATLCGFQTSPVGGDAYTVQNNEWGSTAPECVSTDGGTDFTVTTSSIANRTDSYPGGGNDYDASYDIWFNRAPATSGQPDGTELMIWLNHNGPVQPFGSQVATGVSLGGRRYNVWYGRQTTDEVAYTLTAGTASVSDLDLRPLVADAIARGYLSGSWYLIDVEAGFEVWSGGAGLVTNSFSVHVTGGGGPWPSPIPVRHRGPAPGR